jgi:hypothetical protein
MYFSFQPTFCSIYRLQARKFNASSGMKVSCRIREVLRRPRGQSATRSDAKSVRWEQRTQQI